MSPKTLPRTVRLEAIDDVYCGTLFPLDQKDSFAEETIPIFYGTDSKMLEHFTGEMLEVECKIVQVPTIYRKLINQKKFFSFEKEENVLIPFGLQVSNAKPYGLVDSFKINTWLIGNINPPPSLESKESTCFNCSHVFSYMGIDPLDWPPKYGCSTSNVSGSSTTDKMKRSTKEFHRLEEKGNPYVVFPEPFKLFEVFHPNVDIFNASQKDHSHDLLIGAVKKNLQSLFSVPGVFPPELKIPPKIVPNVDFQYDQRMKLTEQNFDSTQVPKWTCPDYVFNPKWRERLTEVDQG